MARPSAPPSASRGARCAPSRLSCPPRSTLTFCLRGAAYPSAPHAACRHDPLCVLRQFAARPQIVHLAFPNFVSVPPGAREVPSTAVLHLTMLDASHGLVAALVPGRPVERVTLRVPSTLYGDTF